MNCYATPFLQAWCVCSSAYLMLLEVLTSRAVLTHIQGICSHRLVSQHSTCSPTTCLHCQQHVLPWCWLHCLPACPRVHPSACLPAHPRTRLPARLPAASPARSSARLPACVCGRADTLWVEKYKPRTTADLVGATTNINTLRQWLHQWEDVHLRGATPAQAPRSGGWVSGAGGSAGGGGTGPVWGGGRDGLSQLSKPGVGQSMGRKGFCFDA